MTATPLAVVWNHGSESAKHNGDPDIQIYRYDDSTYILRQNMAVNYEAPFLYLLLGRDRALLIDTGATAEPRFFPLRSTVDALIERWTAEQKHEHGHEHEHEHEHGHGHEHAAPYSLIVAHSHSHGDHRAGDSQFAGRAHTEVVSPERSESFAYFGVGVPADVAQIDLGGRVVDVFSTPGHDDSAVTYYDRAAEILLTGDTVYSGRLYVYDWQQFVLSIERIAAWCDTHPVRYILGCHIEMSTTPGEDFAVYLNFHPDEHPLELAPRHVTELCDVLRASEPNQRIVLDELIVTPVSSAY